MLKYINRNFVHQQQYTVHDYQNTHVEKCCVNKIVIRTAARYIISPSYYLIKIKKSIQNIKNVVDRKLQRTILHNNFW